MASSKDYEIEMIVEEDEVMMSQSQCVPDGERCGRSDGLGNPLPGGSYIGPGCYRGIWADSHRVGWSAKHDIWVKRSDVCCDGYAMGEPNFRSSVTERYYYCKVNGCWGRKSDLIIPSFLCYLFFTQTKMFFSIGGKRCGQHGTLYNTGCYQKRRNGNEWAGCCSGKIQRQGPPGRVYDNYECT